MKSKIYLNDLLGFKNLDNVKIRFNLMFDDNWSPVEVFKEKRHDDLLRGQYWNYKRKRSYKVGEITVGFIRLNARDNTWLLFHVGQITKDLGVLDGMGYEFRVLPEDGKYSGRLIIRFRNTAQNMVRHASSVIEKCEVVSILPDVFEEDLFPGYDRVNISWDILARVLENAAWKSALRNQKGVYLITDSLTGKCYVGSAYGEEMILGRWMAYAETGHGGNVEFKKVRFEYIKKNFRYSILDIYKSNTDDQIILEREGWWKELLLTRKFGFNRN